MLIHKNIFGLDIHLFTDKQRDEEAWPTVGIQWAYNTKTFYTLRHRMSEGISRTGPYLFLNFLLGMNAIRLTLEYKSAIISIDEKEVPNDLREKYHSRNQRRRPPLMGDWDPQP